MIVRDFNEIIKNEGDRVVSDAQWSSVHECCTDSWWQRSRRSPRLVCRDIGPAIAAEASGSMPVTPLS